MEVGEAYGTGECPCCGEWVPQVGNRSVIFCGKCKECFHRDPTGSFNAMKNLKFAMHALFGGPRLPEFVPVSNEEKHDKKKTTRKRKRKDADGDGDAQQKKKQNPQKRKRKDGDGDAEQGKASRRKTKAPRVAGTAQTQKRQRHQRRRHKKPKQRRHRPKLLLVRKKIAPPSEGPWPQKDNRVRVVLLLLFDAPCFGSRRTSLAAYTGRPPGLRRR
jgi:hypothetical protein